MVVVSLRIHLHAAVLSGRATRASLALANDRGQWLVGLNKRRSWRANNRRAGGTRLRHGVDSAGASRLTGAWQHWASGRLDDGWILDQAGWQLVGLLLGRVRFADVQVLNIASTEDDVLEDLIAWQDWTVSWTVLSTE